VLWRRPLERLCGGKDQSERQAALRQYTSSRPAGALSRLGPFGGRPGAGSEALPGGCAEPATPGDKVAAEPGERSSWDGCPGVEQVKGESWREFSRGTAMEA